MTASLIFFLFASNKLYLVESLLQNNGLMVRAPHLRCNVLSWTTPLMGTAEKKTKRTYV